MRTTRTPRWKSAIAGIGAAAAIGGFTAVADGVADSAPLQQEQAGICLLCLIIGDSVPDDPPDDDDLWQSECDSAGDCQSVPYGGFMDPGPGAPTGPHGPLW